MFRQHGYCYAQLDSEEINEKLSPKQVQAFTRLQDEYSALSYEYFEKVMNPINTADLENYLFHKEQHNKYRNISDRLYNMLYPPSYEKCYIPEFRGYLANVKWIKFVANRLALKPEYLKFKIPGYNLMWRR